VIILNLALWFPLETLAKVTSYLILIVFALVNASLISIKRSKPAAEGIINVPIWVPVAGFLSSVSLVLFQLLV
jgi:amino acid transporter